MRHVGMSPVKGWRSKLRCSAFQAYNFCIKKKTFVPWFLSVQLHIWTSTVFCTWRVGSIFIWSCFKGFGMLASTMRNLASVKSILVLFHEPERNRRNLWIALVALHVMLSWCNCASCRRRQPMRPTLCLKSSTVGVCCFRDDSCTALVWLVNN